ncbi:MAG: hypothetical protein HY434_00790 [Candidatus Liptonbacteria bacterium]|nr:hypothetical protein [Parcubacteria group bacterium]MBI4087353.1 hypothetical protein [Candidatus Liptonbacteria bacterium]
MANVIISEKELNKLTRQSRAYKKLTSRLFELVVKDPVSEVVEDFTKTGLYSRGFLRDMEAGLRKSSYGKQK